MPSLVGSEMCIRDSDRTGHPQALKEGGADVVVSDLSQVSVRST